jgi:hypothetical protein
MTVDASVGGRYGPCSSRSAALPAEPIAFARCAERSSNRQDRARRSPNCGARRTIVRARRSEERETAHQDRWAAEIHALRESLERLKGERARRQTLEDQVVRLQRELQALYSRLARYEG